MKKIFTLMIAIFAMAGTVNAKTVTTVKTLWEETYSNHIEISKNDLAVGTITVYMSWSGTEGIQIRAYYKKNDNNWTESKFSENGGTIVDYQWQNNGTASYSFNIAESDMVILNDNTENTGSRGILYIGSADKNKMTITKITLTTTATETETNTTSLWTGSVAFENWSGKVNSIASTASAKVGDMIKVTFSSATTSDNAIWVCKSNAEAEIIDIYKAKWAQTSVASESGTVEFEITDAVVLEDVQSGIMLKGKNATITAVDLLTYASSYDAVAVTIGEDKIATFSCGKKLNFSGTGVTPYYASAVASGTVTLTSTTTTWDNQGFIVKGNEGTYTIPVTDNATYQNTDYLKAQVNSGTVTASTTDMYHYIFAKKKKGDANIGFYKLTADHTLGAKKAYLETTGDITPTAESRGITLDFGDGTTAILDVFQDETHQNTLREDGKYYTLQGTCVERPTKGLYILNGKKVLVK